MPRLPNFRSHYQKIKAFYLRFERWLLPVTLGVGFVADYITFVNIQINTALILLYVYWTVAASAILFTHMYDGGKISEKFRYLRLFAPLLVQFTFGGLLSNSFIFYWFSSTIWTSWPFILAFVLLMVSNDALRHYFLRPLVQLAVFYFATFSIVSVTLPFVFNSLSPWLFVASGIISLIAISLLAWLLSAFSLDIKRGWHVLGASMAGILAVMNIFYFANIVPPVPLAIREAGAYHSVQRAGGQYVLTGESETFWQKVLPGKTLHLNAGERAYAYTAIFAPTAMNTTIVHHWQYYDEQKGEWVNKDTLSFKLTGGRKEGFRGYSWKSHMAPGDWRVYVRTQRGQTLGRIKFKVERSEVQARLIEVVR